MSHLLNIKSNENIIYAWLGFHVCRDEVENYENCKRTGTAGVRDPTQCYFESKQVTECVERKATKLDPISIPIFNDARECLFQNDSHIFNCKEELNELLQSHINPANYQKMLLASTPHQKTKKSYNTSLHFSAYDYN